MTFRQGSLTGDDRAAASAGRARRGTGAWILRLAPAVLILSAACGLSEGARQEAARTVLPPSPTASPVPPTNTATVDARVSESPSASPSPTVRRGSEGDEIRTAPRRVRFAGRTWTVEEASAWQDRMPTTSDEDPPDSCRSICLSATLTVGGNGIPSGVTVDAMWTVVGGRSVPFNAVTTQGTIRRVTGRGGQSIDEGTEFHGVIRLLRGDRVTYLRTPTVRLEVAE